MIAKFPIASVTVREVSIGPLNTQADRFAAGLRRTVPGNYSLSGWIWLIRGSAHW